MRDADRKRAVAKAVAVALRTGFQRVVMRHPAGQLDPQLDRQRVDLVDIHRHEIGHCFGQLVMQAKASEAI